MGKSHEKANSSEDGALPGRPGGEIEEVSFAFIKKQDRDKYVKSSKKIKLPKRLKE